MREQGVSVNKALKVAGLSFALMAAGMGSALAETKIAVVDMGEVFQKAAPA